MNKQDLSDRRWGMIQRSPNGLRMIDLFCGAGIGACGFKLAGYEIVYAIDNKPYAVETYNQNIGQHAEVRDIRTVSSKELPFAQIVIAGIPCQPWSVAGNGEGERHQLSGDLPYEFLRIVRENQYEAFILENVDGLIQSKNQGFFLEYMHQFEEAGYRVCYPTTYSREPKAIDCWEYGVPQHRKRIFVVGIRKDLNKSFVFPSPQELSKRTTIRDAIGDLPQPDGINNHEGYGIRNDEAPFVDKIPPGGNWRDLSIEDQKQFLGKAYYSGGGRTGFLRKVRFDKPAHTVTSMMKGKNNAQILDNRDKYQDYSLSPLSRRFTVREVLRLQTVPDWFSFPKSVSLSRQYERCSGIPSLFAYQLGIALAETLQRAD